MCGGQKKKDPLWLGCVFSYNKSLPMKKRLSRYYLEACKYIWTAK